MSLMQFRLNLPELNRTKRFMSDPDWQPNKLLYLPASVAATMAKAAPPPGLLNAFQPHASHASLLAGPG